MSASQFWKYFASFALGAAILLGVMHLANENVKEWNRHDEQMAKEGLERVRGNWIKRCK